MIKFRLLHCSFCGKSETEVSKLVAGPRVYICDECVAVASRIMDSYDDSQPPKVEPTIWRKLAARVRRVLSPCDAPLKTEPGAVATALLNHRHSPRLSPSLHRTPDNAPS